MSLPDRSSPIGIYVHHHGGGHANRCKLLAAAWSDREVTVFSSAGERFRKWEGGRFVELPSDTEAGRDPAEDLLQGEILHYAPTDVNGVSQRMALIAQWIAEHKPALFIVDLSVEIALFVRLCGTRTALVRLNGKRNDPAHTAAFRLSTILLAPFPAQLEDEDTPDWVKKKTIYLGAFSRYDQRCDTREDARRVMGARPGRLVTIINGSGGGEQPLEYWEEVARLNPTYQWWMVGKLARLSSGVGNLYLAGFQRDTFSYLKAADLVIGSGGTNTMLEIGAARRPFLSRPEPRPFGEQQRKMEALARQGLTTVLPVGTEAGSVREWVERAMSAQENVVSGWDQLFAEPGLHQAVVELEQLIET